MFPKRALPQLNKLLARLQGMDQTSLLTRKAAAQLLGIKQSVFYMLEPRKLGPKWTDVSGKMVENNFDKAHKKSIRYRVSDLTYFVQQYIARRELANRAGQRTVDTDPALAKVARITGIRDFDKAVTAIAEEVVQLLWQRGEDEQRAKNAATFISDSQAMSEGHIVPQDNKPMLNFPLCDPRFEGRTITPAQFVLCVKALGMSIPQFCQFWGVSRREVLRWTSGEDAVPMAVADYMHLVVGTSMRLRCMQLGLSLPLTRKDMVVTPPMRSKADAALETLDRMARNGDPFGSEERKHWNTNPGKTGAKRKLRARPSFWRTDLDSEDDLDVGAGDTDLADPVEDAGEDA